MRQYLDIFPVPEKTRTHNSTFAIGGVSCSVDNFVVAKSSVLRINICAKNPAHRKSAKRYTQAIGGSASSNSRNNFKCKIDLDVSV